jgi:hypothetical protein
VTKISLTHPSEHTQQTTHNKIHHGHLLTLTLIGQYGIVLYTIIFGLFPESVGMQSHFLHVCKTHPETKSFPVGMRVLRVLAHRIICAQAASGALCVCPWSRGVPIRNDFYPTGVASRRRTAPTHICNMKTSNASQRLFRVVVRREALRVSQSTYVGTGSIRSSQHDSHFPRLSNRAVCIVAKSRSLETPTDSWQQHAADCSGYERKSTTIHQEASAPPNLAFLE